MNEAEVVVLFSLDICYDVIKNYRDTSRFQLLNYRFVGTVITINSHKTSLLFESHYESFQAVKASFCYHNTISSNNALGLWLECKSLQLLHLFISKLLYSL